jgi:hypothetical protein
MGIVFLLFITCAIFVGLVASVIDHGLSPAQMIAYAWRALLVSTEFLIHGLMEAVAILLSVLLIFGRPIVCIGLFAAAIESTMAMQTMSAKDGERWTIFDGKRSNWLPWVNAILGLLMFKIPDLVPYFREEMIKPELLTLEEARVLATELLGTWDLLHARPVAPTAPSSGAKWSSDQLLEYIMLTIAPQQQAACGRWRRSAAPAGGQVGAGRQPQETQGRARNDARRRVAPSHERHEAH